MRMKGFTLIELILAIVVSSILLLGLANFTEVGVKGYFGTVERYRLQTEANFVIEKISREMRHAVPNLFPSAASSGCVSFYPIVDSGFYVVSGADINFLVSNYFISTYTITPNDITFSMVGLTNIGIIFYYKIYCE